MERLKQYLSKYPDKYIEDAQKLIRILIRTGDSATVSCALNLILEHNERIFIKTREKNYYLRQKEQQYLRSLANHSQPVKVIAEEPVHIAIDIEGPKKFDVSQYLKDILAYTSPIDFASVLPSKEHKDYSLIIKTLLIKLRAEINVIRKLLNEEMSFTKEELIDIRQQYQILVDFWQYILDTSKNEISTDVSEDDEPEETNNIWYLTTDFESPRGCCVLADLKKKIAESYYDTFTAMIQKLRTGYNRNDFDVRSFENDSTLKQVMEMKNTNGSRLFFYNLGNNNIILLGCYIKRQQKDSRLKQFLCARYNMFISQKAGILEALDDEAFLIRQEAINTEIEELLPNLKVEERGQKNGIH